MLKNQENIEENAKPLLLSNGTKKSNDEWNDEAQQKLAVERSYKEISQKNAGSTACKTSDDKAMKKVAMKDVKVEMELVPPDGGWGWLVLFGSMLVNILVPGTVKSFGVLFVEFLEVFDASPAAAAWIPALCYFLYSSLGPLSSILSVKYSYRTVTLLGGTFAVVGMVLSFWAQSVGYLYISYGVLVGTGAGLSFPPTVYIVTSYFVRLRGLANGLCISGSAIGSIILPPILRLLLENYGYRGAVLIMGGITLNVWVGAMFYHPVEQHMKRVPKQIDEDANDSCSDDLTKDSANNEITKYLLSSENNTSDGKSNQKLEDSFAEDVSKKSFIRSASSVAVQNYRYPISPVLGRERERERKISAPSSKEVTRVKVAHSNAINYQIHSSPALHAAGRQPNRSLDVFSQSRLPRSRLPRRSPSTSSFQYVSTPYHGSTLSALHPKEFASSLTLRSITLSPISKCCNGSDTVADKQPPKRNQYFDVTLLKDPLYLVILVSNSTNAISYTNFIILLPSYAIIMGFDKSLAAWLISIVSALDLVGRIGGSALSDTELLPKQWYFIGGLLVSGLALVTLPVASTYAMLSGCCAVFGLASGVYVGVTAVIMADMLGTDRLTSTYGISLFVNGILQLIGPPLCGLWFEQSGTYVPLFTTLGVVLILGAAIWGFVPFINKREINKADDHLLS